VRPEILSQYKSSDAIWNRNLDLSACRGVPEPTASLRDPMDEVILLRC